VAGTVLEPFGKALAEEESGQLPQIEAEKRQRQYQAQDQQLTQRRDWLKRQMELDDKYKTLAPEQRQQLDHEFQTLGAPAPAQSPWQAVHNAFHPKGMVRQAAPQFSGNAVPEGGTAAQDEANKLRTQAGEAEQQRQQQQMQTQDSWAFFSKFIPDEDKPKAQSEWAMKNLGIAQSLKNIPGAAGQPVKGQDGRYYRPMQQPDGSIVQEPMPPDWTPAPKQAQPKVGTVNGKPAWGTLTQNGWVDPETQQSIPNFIPPPNYAQVAIPLADARAKASAKYGVQEVTDGNGNLVDVPRLNVIDAFNAGKGYGGKEISAPTGQEKSRQDFARSGVMQVQTMRDIINKNKDLFGPGGGRVQDFAAWVGSNSPDAQRFRTAALILADHSAGVFGGRSVHTVDELKDTITSMHLNPAALLAGLDQDEKTFKNISGANGRLPTPEAAPVKPGSLRPKTGARPVGAVGTVTYEGKKYWVDKARKNLGEAP
jgi:hypothetical protein